MNLEQIQKLEASITKQPLLTSILNAIVSKGAKPYVVGGVVRDLLLDHEIKDIDIEVHGLTLEDLQHILESFGPLRLVGKQFGVLRIDGLDIDWSLPRSDSSGRKPNVSIDPFMTIQEASRRRDVTMNAMAIDLRSHVDTRLSYVITDPYGGQEDMSKKRLSAVDNTLFNDDPLRFYRVMHFIGRFEMMPDENLTQLCKDSDLSSVAQERIFEELSKLFLRAKQPSLGLRWLSSIGRLEECMPEVYALIGTKQRIDYHPEGDAFEHTMQTLDAAAALDPCLIDQAYEFHAGSRESSMHKLLIMLGALCHDFGKPATVDNDGRSIGHESAGVSVARDFLARITDNRWLTIGVKKIVRHHLAPGQLIEQGSHLRAYKRLALKLAPEVSLLDIGLIALCDLRGRNNEASRPLSVGQEFLEQFLSRVSDACVAQGPEPPILLGRDLIGLVEPGPAMGAMLKKAYDIQIEESVVDKEELKRRILG